MLEFEWIFFSLFSIMNQHFFLPEALGNSKVYIVCMSANFSMRLGNFFSSVFPNPVFLFFFVLLPNYGHFSNPTMSWLNLFHSNQFVMEVDVDIFPSLSIHRCLVESSESKMCFIWKQKKHKKKISYQKC